MNQIDSITDATCRMSKMFLEVCNTLSFAKAGKSLGLTGSAVSQAMTSLEESLGFTLFERGTRPLALTSEGRMLRTKLSGVRSDMNVFLTSLRQKNGVKPPVRLGLIETAGLAFGADLAQALQPYVGPIKILSGSINFLLEKLRQNEIDFFISSHALYAEPGISRKRLFADPFVLLLPEQVKLEKFSLQSLACCGVPLIIPPEGTYNRKIVEELLQDKFSNFPIRYEIESTQIAISLVQRGLAWYITQRLAAYPFIEETGSAIRVLNLPETNSNREPHLITLTSIENSVVKFVADFCSNWYEQHLAGVRS